MLDNQTIADIPVRSLLRGSPHRTEELNPFSASGPDLAGEAIRILKKYWRTIGLLGCLGIICALFIFTLPQAPVYQSRATIQVQEINENFLNMKSADPTTPLPDYSSESNIETQIKLLQSKSLLTRVVNKLKEQPAQTANNTVANANWLQIVQSRFHKTPSRTEALAYAAGHLNVRVLETSHVVEIVCDSPDPEIAAKFANTLVTEFMDSRLEARWNSSRHTSEWLLRQLADLKNQLQKSESALQSYARTNNLLFTNDKSSVAAEGLQEMQQELAKARAERILRQARYEQLSSAQTIESLLQAMAETPARENQADDYKTKLADLKRQVGLLNQNPTLTDVGRLQAQVDAVEVALRLTPAGIVNRSKSDFQAAKRREELLQADYDKQSELVATQSDKGIEYSLLKREVDSNRLVYEAMLQRVKETSVTAAMQVSNVSMVDFAEIPAEPYKPIVSKNCVLGLLVGLACGVGLAFLRERTDQSIQGPNETAAYLNLPELGVIPAVNLTDRQPVEKVTRTQRSSVYAEAVRAALTSILFAFQNFQSGLRPIVLMLSSSAPSEGKTTVLCNLGIAMAETRRRVLLIDADLRQPRLHSIFQTSHHSGLTDILMSENTITPLFLEEYTQSSGIDNLTILTSGTTAGHLTDLLYSVRLHELFRVARQSYDAILIDTAPMAQLSDARILARFADGVVFVVRSEKTSRDAAILATSRFREDGTPVIGTILNNWNPKREQRSSYGNVYTAASKYVNLQDSGS